MTCPPIALRTLLALMLAASTAVAAAEPPTEDPDWPLADRLLERYAAGRYAEVADEGPRLLVDEPEHVALRQAVANSLLWTGQAWAAAPHYRQLLAEGAPDAATNAFNLANALAWTSRTGEAARHYSALLDGPRARENRLALANAWRWHGRPDLALPHYQQTLAADPANADAQFGALLAERSLRPRTELAVGYQRDNAPTRQRETTLRHTWRNAAGNRIYSLGAAGGRIRAQGIADGMQALSAHIEDHDLPLAPSLSLSRQVEPTAKTFAHLRLRLADAPVHLEVGRINWGKAAFNARAIDDGLSARHVGLEFVAPTPLGLASGALHRFAISDDNQIDTGDLRFVPWARPLGQAVRPVIGVSGRYADRTDPRYWSPERYLAGYLGLEGELVAGDWSLAGYVQGSFRLAGEATTSWAAVLHGKRWLNRDWAVGARAALQNNAQGGAYRTHSVLATLERLW